MAELTEAVAEVAEEVADQADHVAEVSRELNPRGLGIGFAAGLAVGAAIGGLYVNRHLRLKYEEIAEKEIDEMREHFRKRHAVRDSKPDLEELDEKVKDLGYGTPNTPVLEESKDEVVAEEVVEEVVVEEVEEGKAPSEEERKNIFEEQEAARKGAEEGWDYEAEVAKRRPDYPYVIHQDEQHERGYTELSWSYYTEDDVLADEHDSVVEEIEGVVGVANLEKFGHGSDDRNVVHIRNDKLGVEVEITKIDAFFSEVVHGFKHSENYDEFPDRRRRERERRTREESDSS